MKRLNNLYDKICTIENVNKADKIARKHKKRHHGIKQHDRNKDAENQQLLEAFKNLTYQTSQYTTYTIFEPKERLIFRLPYFPDRVAHHMIMNILEPIWMSVFTKDTYSSMKGRGIHAVARNLRADLNKGVDTQYCLKLDIRKFYPSIDHEILKQIMRRKLKDKKLLLILDGIIDSAAGVPIGNYLSQYFANLYLAYFDHWVKEVLKVKNYYRYADDIVLLSDDKAQLHDWLHKIKLYLDTLNIQLKPNYQIFPVDSRGIDFIGYRFYHTHTELRKSIKKRMFKVIESYQKGLISRDKLERTFSSYYGWLLHCDSINLMKKINSLTGLSLYKWNGEETRITKWYGKTITIYNVVRRNRYFIIRFTSNGKSYWMKSTNKRLLMLLDLLDENPNTITVPKCIQLIKSSQPSSRKSSKV